MELIIEIAFYLGTFVGVPNFLFSLAGIKSIWKTYPLLFIIVFEQVATPLIGLWFSEVFGSNYLSYTVDNIFWMCFLWRHNKSLPNYTNVFFIVLLLQEFIHVMWFPTDNGVLIYFQLSIFAILICGMNLYQLGLVATDKFITRNPLFLINAGIIFYFALSLVSYLFFNVLIQGPLGYFLVIPIIQMIAALTLTIFIFISIWRIIWK